MTGQLGWAASAGMIAALVAGAASAQGICVDCRDPDRSYSCSVKSGERVQGARGGNRAIEFLCISEIARAHGHQSCRINTSYQGPCMGHPHDIDLAKLGGGDSIAVDRPTDADGAAGQPPGAAGVAPTRQGPPQTLEELARETMAKSKEQIAAADEKMRKAGDAVGDAVKKTWTCITSLFDRC